MRKPQRSLVLREAVKLLAIAEQLRIQVGGAASKGVTPMIDNPKALHSYIQRIDDHLDQIKTLVQYRSVP